MEGRRGNVVVGETKDGRFDRNCSNVQMFEG